MSKKKRIPYSEMDPKIVELCRAINEFPGIETTGSCQGFIDGHRKREPWQVFFGRTKDGAIRKEPDLSIEFLVYLFNGMGLVDSTRPKRFDAFVKCNATSPALNIPGECLYFHLEGRHDDPDAVAKAVRDYRKKVFVPLLKDMFG